MCEKHHARLRRNIPLSGKARSYRYKTGSGYIKLLRSEHPLADSKGNVFEHRAVMHEQHKGLCPACYWCGVCLEWRGAVVDHLNEVKDDNRPENLVVSCNDCNRARGALLPFVKRMTGEAFEVFTFVLREQRDAALAA